MSGKGKNASNRRRAIARQAARRSARDAPRDVVSPDAGAWTANAAVRLLSTCAGILLVGASVVGPTIAVQAPVVPLDTSAPTPALQSNSMQHTQVLFEETKKIIKSFEGVKLTPYRDSVGHLTYCAGHKHTAADNKLLNQYRKGFPPELCEKLLNQDLTIATTAVLEKAKKADQPMGTGQAAAFSLLVFNVGVNGLSKNFVHDLGEGNYESAVQRIPNYNKAGKSVLKGLTIRRRLEFQIAQKNITPNYPATIVPTQALVDLAVLTKLNNQK